MKLALITAQLFGRTSADKNGEQAIILVPVAGSIPNKNVISGTVAKRSGFENGKSYLCTVRETGKSEEFGRQFQWQKVMEITNPMDIVNATKELGTGVLYSVEEVAVEKEVTAE